MRDRGLLESATARPFHSVFQQDAYPTVFDKGVALFHALISDHPFQDGNKRTAVVALNHFLIANAFIQLLSDEELYSMAVQTASYRARGLNHDDALAEISRTLQLWNIPLVELRRGRGDDHLLSALYDDQVALRKRIRSDARNSLLPE